MPFTLRPPKLRRVQPGLQHINSPLSRAAYAVEAEHSYLLLLHFGRYHFRAGSDDNSTTQSGPSLMWWAEPDGHELVFEAGSRGILLSIPKVQLVQALPPTPLGEQMRRTLSQNADMPLDDKAPIIDLLAGYTRERASPAPGGELAAVQYLTLILIQLWRGARQDIVAPGGAPQGLSERFVLLAGQRMREHWTVQQYADVLGVRRDRLGSAVKRATGLSPQAYLHKLLLREAMELLANTGTPVAQVAFRLGFVDPAYFTRFFKRETGHNPGKFRKISVSSEIGDAPSFAAWP
jgi:AraC family transcriptional activator of pobA